MSTPTINQYPLPDLELLLVEGGDFLMGNDHSEYKDEKPAHPVAVSSFYLGKYFVTQRLYTAVMGENENSSAYKGPLRPVDSVSWEDAQAFIAVLNEREDLHAFTRRLTPQGAKFRLPTEAEWEYAARGGRYSQGYLYAGSDRLKQVGWYNENSDNETKDVGRLLANELGLHDMSGNVWEWCEDDWHDNYQGAPVDGSAWIDRPKRGANRVLRGGSCFHEAQYCRPACRSLDAPLFRRNYYGFRLVLPLQSVG